jgi:hypothetical protein
VDVYATEDRSTVKMVQKLDNGQFTMLDVDFIPHPSIGNFDYYKIFKNGTFVIVQCGRWSYYSNRCELMSPRVFTDYRKISENIVAMQKFSGSWMLIDNNGNVVDYPTVLDISKIKDGKAIVSIEVAPHLPVDNTYNILDVATGKLLLASEYMEIKRFKSGWYAAKIEEFKYVLISPDTKTILSSFRKVKAFSNGIGCVKDDDGWYYIDQDGNDIFGKRFSKIESFKNDHGIVGVRNESDGTMQFSTIDKDGNLSDESFEDILRWKCDEAIYTAVDRDLREFHIYPDGTRLYNETYHKVYEFRRGFSLVSPYDTEWCHIDHSGKKINHNLGLINYIDEHGLSLISSYCGDPEDVGYYSDIHCGLVNLRGDTLIALADQLITIIGDDIFVCDNRNGSLTAYKALGDGCIEILGIDTTKMP